MTPAPDTGRTAEEMREFVLIKRGLYWRPNAMGYTGVLAEAGLYTEAEASARSRPGEDGVTMQLASEAAEFAPACWQETKIAVLSQQVAHLRAENANLRDRVREAEGAGRGPSDTGSQATPEAPSDLRPSGVDPSRLELSEETRAFIREIDLATVRPGDPRLSQTLIGPAGPAIGLDGYGSQARPLAPSYDPPRCTATGNPCGTDTCAVGRECPDTRWGGRCAHRIAKRVAALGIEARQGRDEGSACESPTPQGGMPTPLPNSRSENTGGRGAP